MANYEKFNSFVEALAEKKHDLGSDTLKIALCAAANAPVAANGVLADLTEIDYTNCSSRDLTVNSSSQTSGTYKLALADLTLTASGGAVGPFRYAVIYNDTAGNKELIGFYDYGAEVTLNAADQFVIDFDASTGVLTVA